jgi:hypothetical protein
MKSLIAYSLGVAWLFAGALIVAPAIASMLTGDLKVAAGLMIVAPPVMFLKIGDWLRQSPLPASSPARNCKIAGDAGDAGRSE